MANNTITDKNAGRLKSVVWFVALWCCGVGGAMLLALPFRLMIHAAMR